MRRPLFMVCLCLVAAVALWLSLLGPYGGGEEACMHSLPPEEQITITGRVLEKNTQGFKLKIINQSQVLSAAASRQKIPMNENIICEIEEADRVRLGSIVTVCGLFNSYEAATNPGEFDAKAYYHRMGSCGKLKSVELLACSQEYSVVKETLYQIKSAGKKRLYYVFPEKEASILTAMLLGDKEELDEEIKELYQENGIIHILSISGLHITMLGMGIYRLLRRMGVPVWPAAIVGGCVLVLYGVMTGMSVSATRAIGMYLLRMLAEVVGRTYDMLTALGVMAVWLIGRNPQELMNAGFLLSFGAVMGIGVLYPALLPGEEREVPKLFRTLVGSCSITLFTLPIQLWFYYEIPTYSILINLLVLPFISVVMMSGLFAMLVPGFGMVGTVTCLILQGYEGLCEVFSALPMHHWNPGKPMAWQLWIYYVLLLVVVILRSVRTDVIHKDNRRYIISLVMLTIMVSMVVVKLPKGNRVTFLDVGQGDGIVVEAAGKVFLFDCGSSSKKMIGEYVLSPFLKYNGIDHIDGVFVSHGDADHCSGIRELLIQGGDWGITIGQLVLPALREDVRGEAFSELIAAAKAARIPLVYVEAGDRFAIEGAVFECLHPPNGYEGEDSNAASQCFCVEWETGMETNVSLLLTGDVGSAEEVLLGQALKNRDMNPITILKVAHHGSGNSTSEEFLKQIRPKLAVISCGENNSYGHPHSEVLERLRKVGSAIATTPEYGAITVELDKEIRVYGYAE